MAERDSARADDLLAQHGLRADAFLNNGFGVQGDAPSTLEVDRLAEELEALRVHHASSVQPYHSDADNIMGAEEDQDGGSELDDEFDDDLGPSVSDAEPGTDTDSEEWSDEDGTSTLVGSRASFHSNLPNAQRSMRSSRSHRSMRPRASRPPSIHRLSSVQNRASRDSRRSSRRTHLSNTVLPAIQSVTNLTTVATQDSTVRSRQTRGGDAPGTGTSSPISRQVGSLPERIRLRDRLRAPASIGFYSNTSLSTSRTQLGSRSNPSLLNLLRPMTSRNNQDDHWGQPAAGTSIPLHEEPLQRSASFDSLASDASTLNETHRRAQAQANRARNATRAPGQAAPAPVDGPRGPRIPRFGRSTPNLLGRSRPAAHPEIAAPRNHGNGGPGNHLFPSTSRLTPVGTHPSSSHARNTSLGNPLFPSTSLPLVAPAQQRERETHPAVHKARGGKFRAGFRRLFAHTLSPSPAASAH